jgi:hypothetical protein
VVNKNATGHTVFGTKLTIEQDTPAWQTRQLISICHQLQPLQLVTCQGLPSCQEDLQQLEHQWVRLGRQLLELGHKDLHGMFEMSAWVRFESDCHSPHRCRFCISHCCAVHTTGVALEVKTT